MKIRSGFVSNSSSSSFCILGVVVGEGVTDEQYEAIDAAGFGKDKSTELDCVYGISDYYEQTLVGMRPSQMRDDETLLQFKQRIVDELHKFGATGVEVKHLDWCTDGGYNG